VPLSELVRDFPLPRTPVGTWYHEAEAHTREWVRRTGIVRSDGARSHFNSISAGRLAACVYPFALPETREAVTDWFSWLFVLDDQCDEGPAGRDPSALDVLLRPIWSVLSASGALRTGSDSPLAEALADLCERIRPTVPAVWWARFVGHLEEYLVGCHWEATNRTQGTVPLLDEYPANRRAAGAIMPSLDLMEFAAGEFLPDSVYADADYRRAVTAAADVVCWTDDVATVAKERARGDVHNLVIVLAHGDVRRDWNRAEMTATAMFEERLNEFLDAERVLLAPGPTVDAHRDQVARNVAGLRAWMRGHLEWGLETARYREVTRGTGVPVYIEDLAGATELTVAS
jgi:hypothetical protein